MTASHSVMQSSQRAVPVRASAFRYNFASNACAAVLVKCPYQFASPFSDNAEILSLISFSINANTSAADFVAGFCSPTCSTIGIFPKSLSAQRSEEHTSELQSHVNLVCRLLLEKKKKSK